MVRRRGSLTPLGSRPARETARKASDAPREIRTPTVQTDHKALNLAEALLVLSFYRRIAHSIRRDGRSGPGGQRVCCHGVVISQDRLVSVPMQAVRQA